MDIRRYSKYIEKNLDSKIILLMDMEEHGAYLLFDRDILIDTKCKDEEEQIKDVIHEMLHTHPDFRGRSDSGKKKVEAVEAEIENITQRIYELDLETRELVKRRLKSAKSSVFNYI